MNFDEYSYSIGLRDKALKFYNTLKNYRKIIVSGHINPDGDCVASTVSTVMFINRMLGEERAVGVIDDVIPERLMVISEADKIKRTRDILAECNGSELFVLVDCAHLYGTGLSIDELKKFKQVIVIDHHEVGEVKEISDLAIVYPKFTSATHLLFRIFCNIENYTNYWIDRKMSMALYIGMNTDSLGFTTRDVDYHLFEDLAEISKHLYSGDINDINNTLYRNDPRELVEYKSYVLSNLKFREQENGIGVVSFCNHSKEYMGSDVHKATISFYNNIKGYEVCFFVKAVGNDKTRISMRSRNPKINVAEVMSKLFGGGGHKLAAGAHTDLPSEKVEEILNNYNFIENNE